MPPHQGFSAPVSVVSLSVCQRNHENSVSKELSETLCIVVVVAVFCVLL